MRNRLLFVVLFFSFAQIAHAGDNAQQPNPKFLHAKDMYQQLTKSKLSNDVKLPLVKRWNDLDSEQKELWKLAEKVDNFFKKPKTDQTVIDKDNAFIDSYNSRVIIWQDALDTFSTDVEAVLTKNGVKIEK